MRNTSNESIQRLSDLARPRHRDAAWSEYINYSTPLFNEQNNKLYGSFPENKPTLREFITPSDVYFGISQTTPLEERPGNTTNSSSTLLQQMQFLQEEVRFTYFIMDRLFTTN